jgi:hypothetical protein
MVKQWQSLELLNSWRFTMKHSINFIKEFCRDLGMLA